MFMIGNSPLSVDNDSNTTIYGRHYNGTKGLWEILTRKNVYKSVVTAHYMKTYKSILQLTNVHLEEFEPSGNIQITKGSKFREVIAKLFPQTRQRGLEKKTTTTMRTLLIIIPWPRSANCTVNSESRLRSQPCRDLKQL
jgi:hypothetical protein